jgi:hypothetical protein
LVLPAESSLLSNAPDVFVRKGEHKYVCQHYLIICNFLKVLICLKNQHYDSRITCYDEECGSL